MNIFKRLFGGGKERPMSFLEMKRQRELAQNIHLQAMEDRRVEREIYRTADDMFTQWLEGSKYGTVPFQGIIIRKPYLFMYNLYDEGTAKYLKADINQIIDGAFECRKQNMEVNENKKGNHIGQGILGNGVYRNYDGSGTNRSGNSNG